MASPPPFVLTFAASDPTGGAGLQADLLTLAGMGCHPLSVVTALTEQDTHGVEDLLPVQAEWVSEQARHVLQATVVTPNSLEARRLAAMENDDEPDLDECARRLLALGCEYVLVTGAHEATDEVINTLYGARGVVREDRWERLPGAYHGSGCTLSSAIAAALANGRAVPEAVRDAQEYTWQALAAGFRAGAGQLLPDRFFWARELESER